MAQQFDGSGSPPAASRTGPGVLPIERGQLIAMRLAPESNRHGCDGARAAAGSPDEFCGSRVVTPLAGASLHGAGPSASARAVIRAVLDVPPSTCAGPEFVKPRAGVFSEPLLMDRANDPSVDVRPRALTRDADAAVCARASIAKEVNT
jgi:hypothetical protein